jgi:hypothetical protein
VIDFEKTTRDCHGLNHMVHVFGRALATNLLWIGILPNSAREEVPALPPRRPSARWLSDQSNDQRCFCSRKQSALRAPVYPRACRCARLKKCRVACSRASLSVMTMLRISLSCWNILTIP